MSHNGRYEEDAVVTDSKDSSSWNIEEDEGQSGSVKEILATQDDQTYGSIFVEASGDLATICNNMQCITSCSCNNDNGWYANPEDLGGDDAVMARSRRAYAMTAPGTGSDPETAALNTAPQAQTCYHAPVDNDDCQFFTYIPVVNDLGGYDTDQEHYIVDMENGDTFIPYGPSDPNYGFNRDTITWYSTTYTFVIDGYVTQTDTPDGTAADCAGSVPVNYPMSLNGYYEEKLYNCGIYRGKGTSYIATKFELKTKSDDITVWSLSNPVLRITKNYPLRDETNPAHCIVFVDPGNCVESEGRYSDQATCEAKTGSTCEADINGCYVGQCKESEGRYSDQATCEEKTGGSCEADERGCYHKPADAIYYNINVKARMIIDHYGAYNEERYPYYISVDKPEDVTKLPYIRVKGIFTHVNNDGSSFEVEDSVSVYDPIYTEFDESQLGESGGDDCVVQEGYSSNLCQSTYYTLPTKIEIYMNPKKSNNDSDYELVYESTANLPFYHARLSDSGERTLTFKYKGNNYNIIPTREIFSETESIRDCHYFGFLNSAPTSNMFTYVATSITTSYGENKTCYKVTGCNTADYKFLTEGSADECGSGNCKSTKLELGDKTCYINWPNIMVFYMAIKEHSQPGGTDVYWLEVVDDKGSLCVYDDCPKTGIYFSRYSPYYPSLGRGGCDFVSEINNGKNYWAASKNSMYIKQFNMKNGDVVPDVSFNSKVCYDGTYTTYDCNRGGSAYTLVYSSDVSNIAELYKTNEQGIIGYTTASMKERPPLFSAAEMNLYKYDDPDLYMDYGSTTSSARTIDSVRVCVDNDSYCENVLLSITTDGDYCTSGSGRFD